MNTLASLFVAATVGLAAGVYIEHLRWAAADADRIQLEAAQEHDRVVARDTEREKDDHASQAREAYLEAERQRLEDAYVAANAKLKAQLRQPAKCAPGGTLGDVVVPAGVVDSLRAAAGGAHRALPAGPAASGPGQ